MKLFILISFCCFNQLVWSQIKSVHFSSINSFVQKEKGNQLEILAHQLTSGYKTEFEKTRSIFKWITENISYNTLIFQKRIKHNGNKNSYVEEDDTSSVLKPLDIRVAEGVLKRKVAICDGYSRLFKALCELSGIRSEIIVGYAKTNWTRVGNRFFSNHTWNAVQIDGKWHLLDVTWASGFLNYSDEFIKHYNDFYFLTPPDQFILDHYPENLEWTLLQASPSIQEFKFSPFKSQAYIKNRIKNIYPATGIIEASIGDTISFEIETHDAAENMLVSANPHLEYGIAHPVFSFFQSPSTSMVNGRIAKLNYIIHSSISWLHVVYNGEIVLRYKVQIKNRQPVVLSKP